MPMRLGRYLLLRELAAGGMGRVYAARAGGARGFEKLVAIKLIHDQFARDPKFRSMFLEEARLAARVEHRNVCSVIEFGDEQEVVYLVMEFLSGQPISAVRKRLLERPDLYTSPDFPAMAAHLVAEACEGLHAIHTATDENGAPLNAVHRDVSPENVFVTFDGAVKIMDLGVAHASGRLHDSHKTRPGEFKGKMAYAAPEQFDTGPADPRSDIWAAGAVLWELLVGRYLFWKGNERETLKAILTADVTPPSMARPGLPVELDEVVMRALRAAPSERYGTAREMAKALHRFVASSVGHLGTGEVGEWLDALFPGERRRHAELLARARNVDSTELAQAPPVQRTLVLPSEPGPPASHVAAVPPPSAVSSSSGDPLSSVRWDEEQTAVHGGSAGEPLPSDPDGGPTLREPPPFSMEPVTPPPMESERLASQLRGPDLGPVRRRGLLYLLGVLVVAALALWLVRGRKATPRSVVPTPPSHSASEEASPSPSTGAAVAPRKEGAPAKAVEPSAPPPARIEVLEARPTAEPELEPLPSGEPKPPALRARRVHERRPSPSRAKRTTGSPGYVSVSMRGGWADILVDGTPRGRTPKRLQLSAGRHRIELRPFGKGPVLRRTVRVPAGGTTRITFDAPAP